MVKYSTRKTKVWHWIPPRYIAQPKVTVTRHDGTVDDITNLAIDWEFEDGKTTLIGNFTFTIWNNREQWTDVWTGKEVVYFYCDYLGTAVNKRFKGYIEKVSYNNNKVTVSGRSNAQVEVDKLVTYKATTRECSLIFTDLINAYADNTTLTSIDVSTKSITVNWSEKPFLDCVKELCDAAIFDAYKDYDDVWHFFAVNSKVNNTDAIVHDYNMLSIDEFADDITFVKNKIIVYGATVDGIQIIKSAKDQDSIDAYGERKQVINDNNMTDETQTQEYADYLLVKNKDPPLTGDMTSINLLASIQPGDNINLSAPQNNVPPGSYPIISYKHKYSVTKGYTTTVKVNKERRNFSNVIAQLISTDNKKNQTSVNPYAMEDTYNFYFNTDSGTHSNTEIVDGVLKPTAGSGTWISENRPLSSNLEEVYIIPIGQTLTTMTLYISGNNGITWQQVSNTGYSAITTAIGSNIMVKVIFNDSTSQIDSLSVQYKTA